MFQLFLAWLVGVILRYLFAWAFDPAFVVKSNIARAVAAIVVGVVVSYLLRSLYVTGWFFYFVMAAGGFMSQYGLEWLNKQRASLKAINPLFLLSVFGCGLWLIPALTFVGAVIFGRQAYIAHNSNS